MSWGGGMPGGEIFLVGRRKSGGEIFLKNGSGVKKIGGLMDNTYEKLFEGESQC